MLAYGVADLFGGKQDGNAAHSSSSALALPRENEFLISERSNSTETGAPMHRLAKWQ